MKSDELAVVTTAHNWAEAALIEGFLKKSGIQCIKSGDDAGGLRPELTFTRGIRILCLATEEGRARKLLEELRVQDDIQDEEER